MSKSLPARWLVPLYALAVLSVSAQTAPASPPAAAPAMPAAPAPYRSALEGYQAFADQKMTPWQEANDTVGKVGGWRAYAKEAAQPDAAAGAPPTQPAVDPHAGHGKR